MVLDVGSAGGAVDDRLRCRRRSRRSRAARPGARAGTSSRQCRHVAPDRAAAGAGEHAGDRVRVEEQRQRRAERERRVLELVVGGEQRRAHGLPGARRGLGELGRAGVEDRAPAAELERQVDDRDEDDQVDQQVLDHRDQRRRAQPRLVGVGGEHDERDEQRRVAPEPRPVEAHRAQHGLEPGELQGDVGHRRDDPGDRDEQGQHRGVVAAADEVGRGHVAVHAGHRPQAQQRQHDQRERDDRVGHGVEAQRAGGEQQRRDRDEGVRGVEVPAEQEPRHPRAELPPAQPPFVEVLDVVGAAPAAGHEAHDGDADERAA